MSSPLDPVVAAGLGALQGLTEFLPVSSSGHVAIGAWLFGVDDMPLSMVVVVHAGTLLATLLVVGRDVLDLARRGFEGLRRPKELLATDEGKVIAGVVAGSVPTAVMGLLLKDHVEAWSHVPWIVGIFLLGSAAVVLSTLRGGGDLRTLPLWGYILIGAAQGLAVMPGLSRSGATIAAAMLLGLRAPEAFRFSFILSLPAVSGAAALELSRPGALAELGSGAVIAGAVAFAVGWVCLLLLRQVVTKGRFWVFSLYLVPVGIFLIVWDGFLS